jgi:hypothetical protein
MSSLATSEVIVMLDGCQPQVNSVNILISGFRRDVDDICALLGYYAASCGNCFPTFRDNV